MDNAPWHKKAKRLIFEDRQYSDIKEAVTIIFLPHYSPDYNLIEQVWRITRREKTHNRFWAKLEMLVITLDHGLPILHTQMRSWHHCVRFHKGK